MTDNLQSTSSPMRSRQQFQPQQHDGEENFVPFTSPTANVTPSSSEEERDERTSFRTRLIFPDSVSSHPEASPTLAPAPKTRRKRSSRRSRLSQTLHLDDDPRMPRLPQPAPLTATTSMSKSSRPFLWTAVVLSMVTSLAMISMSQRVEPVHSYAPPPRPDAHWSSAAGLRGQMTSGHWDDPQRSDPALPKASKPSKKDTSHAKSQSSQSSSSKTETTAVKPSSKTSSKTSSVHLPPTRPVKLPFGLDANMYRTHSTHQRRVVALDPAVVPTLPFPRAIPLYPADVTDNTQLYSILDSSDERLSLMELREPYSVGECVPMQSWQTTFHPLCNGMHEVSMADTLETEDLQLFGTKGFWRYAWRVDVPHVHEKDTMVLKTLKYEHNFEDAHFEHDRVDAVAMERLTSSPHVINVFGFCGHSVLTEYADGSRVGELADKAKKKPLERLRIARDIATGLADVHGIDGDGNATFVHLDINPANVVSIGGTLKLNDFNIGIIRRWNTTSNKPCGFPAQYPNPQWRSPEEARNEQNLTEKVDIFSMGHIFFRLICSHEPWNKLQPNGRPSKEEVNDQVQKGVLPFIPEDVMTSDDPEVVAIRDAMLGCYTFDPVKRPSARTIAKNLQKALDKLSK
eukprot:Nitzschia sp. Nitz4//scaffold52_size167869//93974//95935//NITZ4_002283-RA/size167869-snap-gene-0.227-mRNA-1//-1//CDS//3329554056//7111//frame0